MEYVAITIRCLIGIVFLVSSISKVVSVTAFGASTRSVRELRLMPEHLARPLAGVVVAAEFAVCALLALPARLATAAGLGLAIVLLGMFAIAILRTVHRAERVACRCFGTSAAPLSRRHAVRNAVLAATAAIGIFFVSRAGAVDPDGVALAVLGGTVVGGLVPLLDHLVELFRPVERASGDARGPR